MKLGILEFTMLWAVWHGALHVAAEDRASPQRREVREYQVLVDNRPAGVHRITATTDGLRRDVEISTNVKINYFAVYTYIYRFQAHEVWEDGQLVDVRVSSLDDGKRIKIDLHSDAKGLTGTFNGIARRTSAAHISTAYWLNPDRSTQPISVLSVLDVDTGESSAADWKLVGREAVTVAGKDIACRRYRIGGPTPADLWFDERDYLVLQKGLEDGHPVELRLTQRKVAKK